MSYLKDVRIARLQKMFLVEIHRFNEAVEKQAPSEKLEEIRMRIDKISGEIADLRGNISTATVKSLDLIKSLKKKK